MFFCVSVSMASNSHMTRGEVDAEGIAFGLKTEERHDNEMTAGQIGRLD